MKNSKEYAKKIQTLFRSLKRKHKKVKPEKYEAVTDALVYAVISEKMSSRRTDAAIKRFSEYFVDLNDLRVSRIEEIVELLGENTEITKEIAQTITTILQSIFNSYHKVSLDSLKKLGKRPARQILEKMEGMSRFVVDYCMLTALGGHAVPLTQGMINYLKNNELVNQDADEKEIAGFIVKQISARSGYEFYALLRLESEKTKTAKKTKTTKKTRKKTTKKTTKKKKTKKKTTKKKATKRTKA